MINTLKYSILSILVIPCIVFLSCQSGKDKERQLVNERSLMFKIGENFPFDQFLDSAGAITRIDFSRSDLTIVDFWFNTCPPCIEEMKKFEQALDG